MRSLGSIAVSVAALVSSLASTASAQVSPSWEPVEGGEPFRGSAHAFDPMVPTSITTMTIGGSIGLLALSSISEGEEPTEECGLSGCVTVERPVGDGRDWSVPLAIGGATTAVGGLSLLLLGAATPTNHADAGRARVAAGGMVLSLGAGIGVAGASAKALGNDEDDASAMLAMGIVTSAVAAPFVVWGASTWDEERGDRYASTGRIVGGSVLTGVGVLGTAGGVVLAATSADSTGLESGFTALFAVPFLAVGAAGLGVGLPLLAGGSQVMDESDALPDVAVGPTSVQATWRLR